MVKFSENSGRTMKDAIVLSGAKTHYESVIAEKDYIRDKFGEKTCESTIVDQEQVLLKSNKKVYDVVKISYADGTIKKIFFDITEPYKKFVIYPQ